MKFKIISAAFFAFASLSAVSQKTGAFNTIQIHGKTINAISDDSSLHLKNHLAIPTEWAVWNFFNNRSVIQTGHTFVVASQSAMLALSAVIGDVAVRTDNSTSFILQALPASTLGNWVQLLFPANVNSVFARTGTITAQSGDYSAFYSALGHTHPASDIVSGLLNPARLGTGTASSSTLLHGDNTWSAEVIPTLSQVTAAGNSSPIDVTIHGLTVGTGGAATTNVTVGGLVGGSGGYNTSIGNGIDFTPATGGFNTFIGGLAGANTRFASSYNTVVGYLSMSATNSQNLNYNTVIGANTRLFEGSNKNIVLGWEAGSDSATLPVWNNTFLISDSVSHMRYKLDSAAGTAPSVIGKDAAGMWHTYAAPSGGFGTVGSVSVVTANGVSGSVATATTTPAITLVLGAITPSSVAASGTVTGSNLSGTNTGDNAVNSLYSGLITNATHTGDATGATALTVKGINGTLMSTLATGILKNTTTTGVPSIAVPADFPTLNQNTTGNAATVTTNANLTGDATSVGNASTVVKINGTQLSSLGTGLLKNTTGTGIPSIATGSDIPNIDASKITTGKLDTARQTQVIVNLVYPLVSSVAGDSMHVSQSWIDTAKTIINRAATANTVYNALNITDSTMATNNNQMYSGYVDMRGYGWNVTTSGSEPNDMRFGMQPIQNASLHPTPQFMMDYKVNDSSWINFFKMTSGGLTVFNNIAGSRSVQINSSTGSLDCIGGAFHLNRFQANPVAIGFSAAAHLKIGQETDPGTFGAQALCMLGNTEAGLPTLLVDKPASGTVDIMGIRSNNNTSGDDILAVSKDGRFGFGQTTPTAILHVKAGTATASTAPFKLTTGVNLTTAEPGALEYTDPQLFFTNGGSQRQEIPQIQQSRASSAFTATSSTTLTNVTGLTATLVAGKTYRFEAILYTSSNSAAGVKFAIAGTATATNIVYEDLVTDNNVNSAQTRSLTIGTVVGSVTAVTNAISKITGTITVNAAGTLTVQFAQNVSNASASSILQGSTFVVTQIN